MILGVLIISTLIVAVTNKNVYRGVLVLSDSCDIFLGLTGKGNVRFTEIDGTFLKRFRLKYFPALSRDSTYLAFIGDNLIKEEEKSHSLYTLVILENKKGLFKEYNVIYQADPVKETLGMLNWSPDGTKLVLFSSKGFNSGFPVGGFESSLKILDLESKSFFEILKIKNVDESTPSWSRDGKFIYFSVWNQSKGESEVVKCNVETKQLGTLTEGAAPSCSPTSNILLFSDNKNIYQADLDGKNKRILIKDYRAISLFTPIVWAPDGKSFLYYRWGLSKFKPIGIIQALTGTYQELVAVSLNKPNKPTVIYKTDKSFWGLSWAECKR